MKFGVCNLSIVPLRAEASHRSEMMSQVLFAETFEILQQGSDFVKIKLLDTKYEGWIQASQYTVVDNNNDSSAIIVGMGGALAKSEKKDVRLLHGTKISSLEVRFGTDDFNISGDFRETNQVDFKEEFDKLCKYYLNTPYLWGGRSLYGIDCSGFSQVVFNHFGVQLPRDAWQQAELGTVVDFLTEIKAGDLAFFDNEAGRITHVGVMIDTETIIHASGCVRIDKMDSEGIFNADINKYTHRLRIVKRYF